MDNLTDYYSVQLKRMRLEALGSQNNIEILSSNLLDKGKLYEIFERYQVQQVIHLAAQPGVRLGLEDYPRYVESNLVCFENLLQACSQYNIESLIFASSSSVYGDSNEIPLSEKQEKLVPKSYYGATKLCNEITARNFSSRYGLRIFGLRFFTVYGPWGRPDMAYFRIATSLLNGDEFYLFGDGTVVRDFTYIDDVVESIERLQQNILLEAPGTFEIFNIGGGRPFSMRAMIEEFELQSGNRLRVVEKPSNGNDVKLTNADCTKLFRYTGFKPEIPLKNGVDKVLQWSMLNTIRPLLKPWTESVV